MSVWYQKQFSAPANNTTNSNKTSIIMKVFVSELNFSEVII